MKLNSAILMNVVLLFLLATMGGTLWFLLPTRESMDQARLAQSDTAAQSPDSVARDKQPVVDPAANWRAQLARADRDLQSLRNRKEQLGREIAQLTSNSGTEPSTLPDMPEANKLAGLLALRRAELERLQLPPEFEQVGSDRTIMVSWSSATQGKEPVFLQLYAARVLPVDQRYYSVRTIDAAGVAFRVLRRTSVGETLSEAIANGSKFQRALGGIVPQKQYLRCLVAEDSFALLRGIMDLAAEKGVDLQWDPFKDEDGRIVFSPRKSPGAATPHQ